MITLDKLSFEFDEIYKKRARTGESYLDTFKRQYNEKELDYLYRYASSLDQSLGDLLNKKGVEAENYYLRQIQFGTLAYHLCDKAIVDFAAGTSMPLIGAAMCNDQDKGSVNLIALEPNQSRIENRKLIMKYFNIKSKITNYKTEKNKFFSKSFPSHIDEINPSENDIATFIAPHTNMHHFSIPTPTEKILSFLLKSKIDNFIYVPCDCHYNKADSDLVLYYLYNSGNNSKYIVSDNGKKKIGVINHPKV